MGMLLGAETVTPPVLTRHLVPLCCPGAVSVDCRAILRFMGGLIYLSAYFISTLFPKKCPVQRLEVNFQPALVLGNLREKYCVQKCHLGKRVPPKAQPTPCAVVGNSPPLSSPHRVCGSPLPCNAVKCCVLSQDQGKSLRCRHCRDPRKSTLTLCQELCIAARCVLSSRGARRGG